MWCRTRAKAAGLTLQGLGITPDSLEAIVPSYLWRFRKTGQFAAQDASPSATRPEAVAAVKPGVATSPSHRQRDQAERADDRRATTRTASKPWRVT